MRLPLQLARAAVGRTLAARGYVHTDVAASALAGLRAKLAAFESSGRPVVAGPFTGEVGFELLYWIPMLRWALEEFPGLRGRLVVLSRGGVAGWLEGMDAEYVDILSLLGLSDFVAGRGPLKQRTLTDFDRRILEEAVRELDLDGARILHPRYFYKLYYSVVKRDRDAFARAVEPDGGRARGLASVYELMKVPPDETLAAVLPDDFVAVRFYFSASFPDSEENRRWAAGVVAELARRSAVVLLDNALTVDDHRELELSAPGGRIVTIHHLMTPETNLGVQTAALARARAFVGTYGGLSYLAGYLGVPALTFSSRPELTQSWHLELAQRVFANPPWGRLVMLHPEDVSLVALVANAAAAANSRGRVDG